MALGDDAAGDLMVTSSTLHQPGVMDSSAWGPINSFVWNMP